MHVSYTSYKEGYVLYNRHETVTVFADKRTDSSMAEVASPADSLDWDGLRRRSLIEGGFGDDRVLLWYEQSLCA